jgi:dolichyl-phosphate-mannose--protein O-mannosyl transferase
MKLLTRLEKSFDAWFLIGISVVFFLLRLPSLFEPDWYGDEGIYQVLGAGVRAGRLLYRDIFDNKPPFLYLLYSFVASDQFIVRLISLIFGLLSVWVFFCLAKKLFENAKASYISTSIFAVLFGLPLIEGNIANAENFMLLLNILGGYLVIKSLESKIQNTKYLILATAGLAIGFSFLFKIVAVFDFAAFFGFLFFANYSKSLLDILKIKNLTREIQNLSPFLIGFIVPIALVFLFFIFNHAFSNFLTATLFKIDSAGRIFIIYFL